MLEISLVSLFQALCQQLQDALKGLVSKESPVGKALLGKRIGDRVQVEVNPNLKYFVEIRGIEKGEDDESLDISAY